MKQALVTGATKGIGLAIAKMLLEEGYFVRVTYAHDEEAAMVCKNELMKITGNFELIKANQGDKSDMNELVCYLRTLGHLDCMVCNAGMTLRKGFSEFVDEEWENVMQVNVNAPVFMIRDLFDCISPGGRIVFIGSAMGIYPHGTSLAYGVTKAAIHALAKNLVKFFEGTGTTVNAVAPGFVETEWQKNKRLEIRKNNFSKTSEKRFATVEEVADAVKFCIRNPFVNGSVIEVNGGYCFK